MQRATRNYLRLVNELINLQTPFDTEIIGTVAYADKYYPYLSLHTHSKLAKWNVIINAGAHGEEAIGVRVLLRFLQEFDKELLQHYNFIIFPVVNPWGYTYNRRRNGNNQYGNSGFMVDESLLSQEAKFIKDTVPQKVDLFIDLHADLDKGGFYVYERKRPGSNSLAELGLNDLRRNKFPIMDAGTIYREKCVDGVIVEPGKDGSMDDSMFQRGAIYSLCLEIPGKAAEDKQIIGGLMLLRSLLANFKTGK